MTPKEKEIRSYQKKHKCTRQQAVNHYESAHEKHMIRCFLHKKHIVDRPFEMAVEISYRDDGERGGYHENNIDVTRKKDGSLFLWNSDRDSGVYLYPEQLKLLKKFLRQPFK